MDFTLLRSRATATHLVIGRARSDDLFAVSLAKSKPSECARELYHIRDNNNKDAAVGQANFYSTGNEETTTFHRRLRNPCTITITKK